jgi:hypothetical protein
VHVSFVAQMVARLREMPGNLSAIRKLARNGVRRDEKLQDLVSVLVSLGLANLGGIRLG